MVMRKGFQRILSLEERSGEAAGSMRRIQDFGDVVNRCRLTDLGFRAVPFTWENRRNEVALVQKQLDKALANGPWLDLFNLCTVTHLVCSYSDHVPLLICLDASLSHCRPKWRPRKLEEKLALHPECEEIIMNVWRQDALEGSPMFKLCEKIKQCRELLHKWYKEFSGVFHRKLKDHTDALTALIQENDRGHLNDSITFTKAEINKLLMGEELH